MSQVACRPPCVERGAGAAAAVGSGRTLLFVFKPESATDGAKESPVLMDSSSGGGASGDADVVATGVVSRGEGCAGAGSGDDVVVTGVVHKGEGGAGAGSFADVVATGVVTRAHKESYPAPPRPPPRPLFFVVFWLWSLGGSFLGCAPVDGLLHILALTKRLGKQANTARARDVKLNFTLFRYVNPCVNARWSM